MSEPRYTLEGEGYDAVPHFNYKGLLQSVLQHCPGIDPGQPRWSYVGAMTSLGSGYSARLCTELGFDPNEILREEAEEDVD